MPSSPALPVLPAFRAAHAVAQDWTGAARIVADAFEGMGGPGTLGFLYATDVLAGDLSSVLTFLRQKTGIEHWIGGTGIGVFGGDGRASDSEHFESPSLAALAAPLGADAFSVFSVTDNKASGPVGGKDALMGFIHGDPMNDATPDAIEHLAEEGPAFLVGGLTSARTHNVQIADVVTNGILSGALLAPSVALATGLTQGCIPLGDSLMVSKMDGNILQALDGRPALEALKDVLGNTLAQDVDQVAGLVHVGIPVEGSDTGDFTVRALAGIDPEQGWLLVGEALKPGDRLFFVRRDSRSAEVDMINMLRNLKGRTQDKGAVIRGGVYVSCIARGPAMFEEPGREMTLIREVLGDFPLTGFYASGEISSSRLYGYTGVLTVFL